jgi:stearoyl-CoA desaturase (delta-9 desaturase)
MGTFIKWRIFYSLGVLGFFLAIYLGIYQGFGWWLLGGLIYSKIVHLLGTHISLHRYFAHSSFKTTESKHRLLCWISLLGAEGSPIMWFIHHNHHHNHSDTEKDLHSPLNGIVKNFFWGFRSSEYFEEKGVNIFPKKLYRDRTVKYIHDNYFTIWALIGLASLIVDWRLTVFFILFPIGHNNLVAALLTVTLYHGRIKFPGCYRNFDVGDASWNNRYVVAAVLGEGYHNNHHREPTNYDQAMRPGEFDPAAWIIDRAFKID